MEFTTEGGCEFVVLLEYEWFMFTGLMGYWAICGGAFDGTAGESFNFLAAADELEFAGFESRSGVIGDDISRFRVPPLNIAFTSSHACATSSGGVPLNLKCRRHELKLAASG